MTSSSASLSRRDLLRGLGISLALPSLPSIARPLATSSGLAMTPSGVPLRMAFLYVPNGVNTEKWLPSGFGSQYQLSESLAELATFKDRMQIIRGLEHKNGTAGEDGPGDHARAGATFLTGARPRKTGGSNIHLGVSVDQLAAQHVGAETRFKSLELSCDEARVSGQCDSGYACAYQFNLSWRSPTVPVAAESNPRFVFERLFGEGDRDERADSLQRRREMRKSVLDFVAEDARRIGRAANPNDRRKLDEYLTSVREIEKQIERVEAFGTAQEPTMPAPSGVPDSYRDHIRVMFDLMAVAFQTDSTRIATFLLAHDGSNRAFPEIGVLDGHHNLSHHQGDAEKLEKIAQIDRFYAEQLAYFLGQLASKHDSDGSVILDNSMILYGSGLLDGNRHSHSDLPVILAGGGGGTLAAGRHVKLAKPVPMTNLYLSMLDRLGARVDSFSDSTGRVSI